MLRVAAGVVVVALIAVVLLLALGGEDPALSPQAQSTPQAASPEPQVERGATTIRITDDELSVNPRTLDRQDGYLTLQMENAASSRLELALVRGEEGADAIVAMPLDPGAKRTDQVGVEAGTYTLLVREPDDDNSNGFLRVQLRLR